MGCGFNGLRFQWVAVSMGCGFDGLRFRSNTNKAEQMVFTRLTMEIHSVDELVVIIDKLSQLPNVQDVKRIA